MARPIEDSDPLVKLRPACEPGAHSLRTAPASRVGPLLLPCRPNIGAATRTQMRPGEGSRAARRRAWLVVLGLAVLLAAPARARLAPGDVLGAENWQEARGLLPEEFLDAYRRGDFRHAIGEWKLVHLDEDPIFAAALKANEGRFDVSDEGSIIDRQTGKAPHHIFAWPFPTIDPTDRKAAVKIAWNYFYTIYYSGNGHYRADLLWINRKGLDRAIKVDSFHKFYEGQPPRFREDGGPDDLLEQTFAQVLAPADVQEILIRRPHWVIEAIPKDPYYLYGKLLLRFDKDIYLGSYSSKYDWQGKLISSYAAIRTNVIRVAPGEYWGWVGGAVALAVNWKLDRATTAGLVPGENVPADSRIPLAPDFFSLQRLTAQGR